MNKLEKLEQEAFEDKVKVHDYYLGEDSLKGIYIDGNVAINTSVSNSTEKTCVLAEELGHHHTSVGDIIDMTDIQNRKQERQARLWGYNKLIGARCAGKRASGAAGSRVLRGHELVADHAPHRTAAGAAHRRACAV